MISLSSKPKPISHFLLSFSPSSKFTLFSLFSTSSPSSSYSLSRRFEEESRNVKVSVWWDIENCSVPSGINAFKIAQFITSAVRVNGIKGPLHISAFGDIFYLSKPNQEALSSTGINLIHIPHGGKNSADRSLLIDLMYWVSQNPPPAHIFLISNDRDFANILYRLRMNNYNILLAAKEGNHIGVLGGAASIMWHWSELVKGENLSGRHFNQPPDGPFNSWYGHYKGPLEDPFDLPEQQNSSRAKNDSSTNDDLSSDKVQPIPKSVLNQTRQIIHSYPYGLSITELRAQMAKNNVTLDKNFYGHKRFSRFLLSMPQILKVVNAADGQFFIRPVSPKVPDPVESDDRSTGPTSADRSSDLERREGKGKDRSITRMIDVEQRLPLSSVNVKKEKTVETREEKISEKKVLDVPMDDQVTSTEEHYTKETVGPDAPPKEQDLKYQMGLFRRLWCKWFSGSKEVEMNATPDIPNKFTTATVIQEKSHSQEGFTVSTSYPSSTVNANSDIDDKSDDGRGILARVLSWFVSPKNQTSVSTPTSQFTQGPDSIEELSKHEDALKGSKLEDASLESKHEDVLHSRKHELFSNETFWNSFESFLRTQRGSDIVLNSASRVELSKKLENDGPLVLRSLLESDLLQLVDLLVSKKWITELPGKTPRFKVSLSSGKSSTPVQTPNSNGLSSLFLSSSPENPQLGISSILPKEPSETEKSRGEILSDCQKLLDELLPHHPEGLNMSTFKRMFSEKNGYHLDHQKVGYSKVVSLLQVMPGVKIESGNIYPDNVVYAPGIESLGLKDKSSGSDSEMTDLPPKDEVECPWEELGPVDNSNLDKEYEPPMSEEELSEEDQDASLTGNDTREQSRSTANGEDSSLVQILNSWYSSKDEVDAKDNDSVSNEKVLVDGLKEESRSFGSSPVCFKSKPRGPKSYTFVADSTEDNKDKLIDGILDNLKKSGDTRMQS